MFCRKTFAIEFSWTTFSLHFVFAMSTVQRWNKDNQAKISIPQPFSIDQYNKGMVGVDTADQNISTYRIGIKTKKVMMDILCLDSRHDCPKFLDTAHVSTRNSKRLSNKICFILEIVSSTPREDFTRKKVGQ